MCVCVQMQMRMHMHVQMHVQIHMRVAVGQALTLITGRLLAQLWVAEQVPRRLHVCVCVDDLKAVRARVLCASLAPAPQHPAPEFARVRAILAAPSSRGRYSPRRSSRCDPRHVFSLLYGGCHAARASIEAPSAHRGAPPVLTGAPAPQHQGPTHTEEHSAHSAQSARVAPPTTLRTRHTARSLVRVATFKGNTGRRPRSGPGIAPPRRAPWHVSLRRAHEVVAGRHPSPGPTWRCRASPPRAAPAAHSASAVPSVPSVGAQQAGRSLRPVGQPHVQDPYLPTCTDGTTRPFGWPLTGGQVAHIRRPTTRSLPSRTAASSSRCDCVRLGHTMSH